MEIQFLIIYLGPGVYAAFKTAGDSPSGFLFFDRVQLVYNELLGVQFRERFGAFFLYSRSQAGSLQVKLLLFDALVDVVEVLLVVLLVLDEIEDLLLVLARM